MLARILIALCLLCGTAQANYIINPYVFSAAAPVGSIDCLPATWDPADGTTATAQATQSITCTATNTYAVSSVALTTGTWFAINAAASTCDELPTLTNGQTCTVGLQFDYSDGAVTAHSDTLTVTNGSAPDTVVLGPVTVTSGAPAADYYWQMLDNAASTTVVATSGGVNGTLVNSGNTSAVQTGTGFDLPSTGLVVAGISSTVFTDGAYTIQGTFKSTDTPGSVARLFAETSGLNKMTVILSPSSILDVYSNGVKIVNTMDVSGRNPLNGSEHVWRIVLSGGTMYVYEGATEGSLTLVTSATAATPSSWGGSTRFGGTGDATGSWNGVIRDVKIWNAAVTP